MWWRVTLLECYDGFEPDDDWARGILVKDHRPGAADLIRKANEQKGTRPNEGEVYLIEAVVDPRRYRVRNDEGHVMPANPLIPSDQPGKIHPCS